MFNASNSHVLEAVTFEFECQVTIYNNDFRLSKQYDCANHVVSYVCDESSEVNHV